MIVWLNGTHGAGKTTTSALVQQLIPDSRVFDAEKVGEALMDITPGLPATDNFQHWPPWRPLVVETARPRDVPSDGLLERRNAVRGAVLCLPRVDRVDPARGPPSVGLARPAAPRVAST